MANFLAVVVASCFMFLAGCSTLQERPAAAQLVIQYATLKYAERIPDGDRQERMERVVRIAETVKGLAQGEATLPFLQAAVASQLDKAGLSPADRVLADGLVQIIAQELQARIGSGALSAEQLVQVRTVMDWVLSAATMASAKAP